MFNNMNFYSKCERRNIFFKRDFIQSERRDFKFDRLLLFLMLSFLSPKKQSKTDESVVSEICSDILKETTDIQINIYNRLPDYLPQYSNIVVNSLLNHMVITLNKPTTPKPVANAILELINTIVTQSPKINDLKMIVEHPNIFVAMFNHAYPLNRNVVSIINALYLKFPSIVLSFLIKSPHSLKLLLKSAAEFDDEDSSELFFRIATANPDLLKTLIPYIKPEFKNFPVSIVFHFMYANNELQSIIQSDEIEEWLSNHEKFTVYDISSAIFFYPFLWKSPSIIKLLLLAEPIPDIRKAELMKNRSTQEFKVPDEIIENISKELLNPKYQFTLVTQSHGSGMPVHKLGECYAFIRLLILSLANPQSISQQIFELVDKLLFDSNEWLAAASMQLIIIWLLNQNYVPMVGTIYKVSALVYDESKSPSFRNLARALLRSLGVNYNKTVSILLVEQSLVYQSNFDKGISKSPWCFPNFPSYLQAVNEVNLVDYPDSLVVLGYIVKFLGVDQ